MREIKFRGVDSDTGEVVYRELGNIFMNCRADVYYFGSGHDVKPATVNQFIGEDKNHRDVYECDTLKDPATGETFEASMKHIDDVGSYELVATPYAESNAAV